MFRRVLCLLTLILGVSSAAFAEPGWKDVKEILRKNFTDKVNCPAADIIKIEDAKDAYYWKNKEYFPAVDMYSYSGWVYYKGELPGEIRRQKIIANFESIAGKWQYKFCGVPMEGGNDQVKPADKLPPLPVPPSIETVKKTYIDYLTEKYSNNAKLISLSVSKFDAPDKLSYVKNKDGSYSAVSFEAKAEIEFVATVKDGGRYQKITGKGPANLSARTSKDPATDWYKSTEVKKWNILILEDPESFHHDYEDIEEPVSAGSSLPSLPLKKKGITDFFK
jgi:hypothetical protein